MELSIIGTGSVGTALASGLSGAGHEVTVGSRDPGGASPALRAVATVTDQRSAAEATDVVVLALPGGAVTTVAADLAEELAGSVVVDPTNEYPDATADRSLAERVADAAPAAEVVKAFNTIGANLMTDPVVDGDPATMFVCGDDDAAVGTVETLAADLGFEAVRTGDLAAADRLEGLARLWIDLSGRYGRGVAFRLLGV